MTRAALATLASAATALGVAPATAGALSLGVTTKSPQDVATTTATMRADVTVSVLGANVSWQYGTSTSYGASTTSVASSLLGLSETVTLPLGGLAPNTTYHVRAVAASALTTAYGRDVSFTTAKLPSSGSGSSGSGSSGNGSSGSGSSGSGSSGSSGSGSSGSGSSGSGSSGSSGSGSSGSGSSASSGSGSSGSGKDTTSPAKTTDKSPSSSDDDDQDGADDAAATDPAAAITPGTATAAVTPVLGKTLAIAAVQGTVTATAPSGAPVDLSAAQAVPTGTVIDTRGGTVELTSALDRQGATQTARFWGAMFEVHQGSLARGLTKIVLRGADFSGCATSSYAKVARAASKATRKKKAKKPVRTLWGSDDHGRFQTQGRGSVATVRGTRWMTRDTCAGTLTRVAAGAVAVQDLRRDTTVVVRRGHEYLARADR
jgi:hypothetical protein